LKVIFYAAHLAKTAFTGTMTLVDLAMRRAKARVRVLKQRALEGVEGVEGVAAFIYQQ
jgi:hypothetical protein